MISATKQRFKQNRLLCICFFIALTLNPHSLLSQCPGITSAFSSPSAATNDASVGTIAWATPNNSFSDNNVHTTISNNSLLGGAAATSNYLVIRNLNFNIPINAVICGIEVEIRKFSNNNDATNFTQDGDIRLLVDNVIQGTNHAVAGVNWPTTETVSNYGSNSDLWGTTLDGFKVSNNGFGVAISVQNRLGSLILGSTVSNIDQVRVRVSYFVPTTDLDVDGKSNNADIDWDGDGVENNRELMVCSASSALTLTPQADPTLFYPSAAGITTNILTRNAAGAGVSAFNISENFTAVAGPEIFTTQDVTLATDQSVQVIRFNSPAYNVSFKLQDIDFTAGTARDRVIVNAYSFGQIYPLTAANFNIGPGNFNSFSGSNTFGGLLTAANNEANGTISIILPIMVDSIRFVFDNSDAALGVQEYGIGEISWCSPEAAAQDFDADGKPDWRDIDSDNDGILDLFEYQVSVGFIAPSGADTDNDGLDNAYDISNGGTTIVAVNTDGLDNPDFHDADSDNDGFTDLIEGNDANRNCVADFPLLNIDTDIDGLDNAYDPNNGGTNAPRQDSDLNGLPDWRQNTVPTVSNAGPDQMGCAVSYTLAGNTPATGLGYWSVIAGSGTFSGVNTPASTVSGLIIGTNIYGWTIFTDGCHSSTDNISIAHSAPQPTPTVTNNGPLCVGATLNLSTPNVTSATFAWTGPNGFTSTLQNPILANVTSANAGVYNVIVTVAGCSSLPGSTTLVVNPIPATPTASSNSPVCVGFPINFTTPNVSGGSFSWTGPNGFTASTQNPSIASAVLASAGTYNITVTVLGCVSPAGTTAVVVNPIPSAPTAGSNSPVCESAAINLTATTVSGATYAWTGPNGFTSAIQNPSIASAVLASAGTYNVTATVSGCTSSASPVTVTINPTPANPTASSNSPVCAGTTINLSTPVVSGANYAWTGPNGFTANTTTPSIANAAAVNAGTYSITITVSGCASAAGTTSVVVNPVATVNAGADQSSCNGSIVTLAGMIGGSATTSTWTSTGTGVFSDPNSLTSTYLPSPADIIAGTVTLSLTTNDPAGPCNAVNDQMVIVISSSPSANFSYSAPSYCQSSGVQSPIFGSGASGGTFSSTAGLTLNGANGMITPGTSTAGTYTVTNFIAANGSCPSASATTDVTIIATPATPIASNNGPVCVGSPINLSTPNVTGGTFAWTGPNSFTSALQNPSIASAVSASAGSYSVVVTVNGCPSLAGTTTVVVNPIPMTPTATNNGPLCVGATLNLSTPNVTGGTFAWTGPNGFTSAIQNPSIASVVAASAGTYSVVVTVNGCPSLAGTTTLVVNPIPAAPAASSNSPVCIGSPIDFTTPNVTGGSFSWTGPNGFTSITQNPSIASSAAVNAGTYSVTVSVNGCVSPAGTTAVVVNPIPSAPTAGSNSPVCESAAINLTATTVSGATYAWTGPNGFTSAIQNPSITSAVLASAGTYNVTATVSGCTSSASPVTVTVNPTPATPTASSNSPLCAGTTINLSTPVVSGANYAWTGPNGFTANITSPSIANAEAVNSGTYSITITVSGCTSAAGTTSVAVNPVATVNAGANQSSCNGSIVTLAGMIGGSATTSTWTSSGTGVFSDPNSLTSTYTPSPADIIAGTVTLTLTTNDPAGPCSSVSSTMSVIISSTPSASFTYSSPSFCQNASSPSPIFGSGASGGTFSSTAGLSINGTNGVVNLSASTPGTYTVTNFIAANGSCPSASATTDITVVANPSSPVITSNSPVCEGSALNLSTGTISGGTYNWTGPNGFNSTVQNPTIPNVTSIESGTYSLFVTNSGCSSTTSMASVTVNTIPASPSPSSNSPVCSGNSINLTTPVVSGANYAWTGPNGFTSNSQSPIISNAQTTETGTYNVTITVNGCSSLTVGTSVTVNATPSTPVASQTGFPCVGGNINLSTPTVSGGIYAWTGPSSFTSSIQSPVITSVTAANSGTYSVTVSTNGCVSNPGSILVIVSSTCDTDGDGTPDGSDPDPSNPCIPTQTATPTASFSGTACNGGTIQLLTPTVSGATYSWSGPNGFVSNIQNPSVGSLSAINSGNYQVIVTANNCSSSPASVPVTVTGTCDGDGDGIPDGSDPDPTNPCIPNQTATPLASSTGFPCVGGAFQLNTNTFSGASYAWTGPSGFTSTDQNPVILNATVSHTGTYQVIVTANNCASAPATVSITVNSTCDTDGDGIPNGTDPDPTNPCIPIQTATPTAGTNGFPCIGGVFQLTANTFAGGVYSWTGPNGFISTEQNPVVFNTLALHAGIYTVTVTVNNCTSSPASTTVVINSTCDTDGDDVPDDQDPDPTNPCIPTQTATPVASFTGFPCEGGTIQLTSNSFASGTYSWTGPNGFTSSAQNPMILLATAAANGVYSVTVTVNNCTSQADTVQISLSTTCDTDGDDVPDDVDPDPNNPCIPTATSTPTISAGSSAACIGSSVELYSLGANADSYSWSGPNSFTSSAQNPVILNATALHSGMYYLTVTDHNCASNPDSISVLVDQSSCDDGVVIPDGFSPNGDGVNDKFVIDGLENYPNNSVKIFNRWGNRLFEAAPYANNWDGTTQFGVTIGGDTLPEGTYFYIITLDATTVKTGYIYLTR